MFLSVILAFILDVDFWSHFLVNSVNFLFPYITAS